MTPCSASSLTVSTSKGAMLVKEGDTLCTGRHTFTFLTPPPWSTGRR